MFTAEKFLRLTEWLRRTGRLEIYLLTAGLLVAAGIWGFAALASEVVEGDTARYDERILLALRNPADPSVPIGPHWTLQVARDVTAMGGVTVLGFVIAVIGGYLLLQRWHGLFVFMLGSVVSGSVLALVLKGFFHRARPQVVPYLTDIATASFPSGHSMISSVAYLTMAALLARATRDWKTKIYCLAVAVILIVAIGCSRVYLGVHFPTDVFAGWCGGATWAILCCMAGHILARRRVVDAADSPGKIEETPGGIQAS